MVVCLKWDGSGKVGVACRRRGRTCMCLRTLCLH